MVEFSPEELKLLSEKVQVGAEGIETKIPDAPDISPVVPAEPTALASVAGRVELKPGERPVIGLHFVIWGSELLDDIRVRTVKRVAVSEDEYARKMRREAERLVGMGLKDPDPNLDEKYHRRRANRAEEYARWRYKGFVCGEVASL